MLRALAGLFAAGMAVALLAALALGWLLYRFEAPGPSSEENVVAIPPGAGLTEIADRLAEAGIVTDARLFTYGVLVRGGSDRLRAGEYAFPAGISPRGAMDVLISGREVAYAITVPEGLTSAEIVALLGADDRLVGEVGEVPQEGALLPETYHVRRGDDRAELVARMRAARDEVLAALWAGRADGLPFDTPEEALVLASIVEEETAVADERPLVAGVFVNRLFRGMRLQSDPTVIYALTAGQGPLGRALTRRDLNETDSPYNTYRVAGLPPGPISNPGRAAIAAAVDPAETEYLYFVADGTGGHAFARTLAEHQRNVRAWRNLRTDGAN